MPSANIASLAWEPPAIVSEDEIVAVSNMVHDMPKAAIERRENIFRIEALGLDWDLGVMVYEPRSSAPLRTGADGKKAGIFLLHGGNSDCRTMEPVARLLAGRFGYKVASMTYPGRLYLPDPRRNWPGDTIDADGSVRTPIWKEGETITRDQYDVVEDASMRARYGTRMLARAKEGSPFYDRMAAWPVAFDEAMREVCRVHFPPDDFSVYAHGHSTGGPFVHLLTQRVANVKGVIGMEGSPFGHIFEALVGVPWQGPFNDLQIRTWRDVARLKGPDVLAAKGPEALMRLPWLMEDVFEAWDRDRVLPQFKAEYIVHYGNMPALSESARAAARRLGLGPAETDALIARYRGYGRELSGPGTKPVPPLLFGLSGSSRDHRVDSYERCVLPSFAAMTPPPKVRLIKFDAGAHHYWRADRGLPMGLAPAAVSLWTQAIEGGYYEAPEPR